MRSTVKGVVEGALCAGGLTALGRWRKRSRSLVLAYHNIVPDDHEAVGDPSLHLPRSRFAEQLDHLRRHVDVVPLGEAISPEKGTRRPRVAITFDDAYRGALRFGIEELAKRGMPATVFACPGRLDGHAFWWDRYAIVPGAGGLRDVALSRCRGRDELVAEWAERKGLRPGAVPDYMTSGSLEDLRAAAGSGAIRIGAHTWSHPNLARATADELETELGATARWLERELGGFHAPYVAYPYGLSSPVSEQAALRAGYRAGLRIRGGWFRSGSVEPFATPRMNVSSGISIRGFALRIAGVLQT